MAPSDNGIAYSPFKGNLSFLYNTPNPTGCLSLPRQSLSFYFAALSRFTHRPRAAYVTTGVGRGLGQQSKRAAQGKDRETREREGRDEFNINANTALHIPHGPCILFSQASSKPPRLTRDAARTHVSNPPPKTVPSLPLAYFL